MCGINGFIDYTGLSSENVLAEMTSVLSHRGPDDLGNQIYHASDAIVGLGHRRLSIIDLSTAGKQPMVYKHFTITFNGEIYNYADIRNQLLGLGHVFAGNSDTEVILHAYEEWGQKCLDTFTGMFAFAIYDSKERE